MWELAAKLVFLRPFDTKLSSAALATLVIIWRMGDVYLTNAQLRLLGQLAKPANLKLPELALIIAPHVIQAMCLVGVGMAIDVTSWEHLKFTHAGDQKSAQKEM